MASDLDNGVKVTKSLSTREIIPKVYKGLAGINHNIQEIYSRTSMAQTP